MTTLKAQPQGIPLPQPTEISRPFWEAARREELHVQRCADCGKLVWIPEAACSACMSTKLQWERSSGKATVYSYSVVYRPQQPSFEFPYVVALLEMEEGWHFLSNVINVELDDVAVGMPVKVTFVRMSEEITLPYFEPASD